MKSIHQKMLEIGTVKNYENGVVGLQQKKQSHTEYAEAMKSLPQNGNAMLSRYFGVKSNKK